MSGYLPGEECSQCKGRCCREHGCSLSPMDLTRVLGHEVTRQGLLSLLQEKEGLFAIDRCNGGSFYYLRMRHKCFTFIGVDAAGECVALGEQGCLLSFENRPRGGRDLKSSPDFHCRQEYTLDMMEKDWAPYQELLRGIWEEYEDRFEKDGTFDACDRAYFEWMKSKRNRG